MLNERFYNRIVFLTIAAVFVLFFLGGLVRSTGAGMGCPDWPKCFGQWFPPSTDEALPANYQEIYQEKRIEKVARLTGLLNKLGWTEKAQAIQQDARMYETHDFNLVKAYTEYINRIFGAVTGVLTLMSLVSSFQWLKTDRGRFWMTITGGFFILFNGWLGAMVVNTNLLPGLVSIHFLTAFLAVSFLMVARFWTLKVPKVPSIQKIPFTSLFLILTVLLVQILFGTQVRESIDILISDNNFRLNQNTVSELGLGFLIHRLSSFLLLILTGYVLYRTFTHNDLRDLYGKALIWFTATILIQIISGSANTLFNLPDLAQVVHITVGSLMFGIIFYICILGIKAYKAYLVRA